MASINALLSYLPDKAKGKGDEYSLRGNRIAAAFMPKAFIEMGYSVDYIDWQDKSWKCKKDYSVFMGHGGHNFEHIANQLPPETRRIYYSTGFYWKMFNDLEAVRFDALEKRRGVRLPPDRAIVACEEKALRAADGIACIGARAVRNSYAGFPLVLMLRNACTQTEKMPEKDYEGGRKHFLFYAGKGNVHKGLDLLLEAFAGTDLHLWVCQQITPEFRAVYDGELKAPNIHVYGRIDLLGREYQELASKCNWVISASCCEGSPQSVLESMGHGLIPVVTYTSSVDIGDFGFQISEKIESIRVRVIALSELPAEECRMRSLKSREDILSNHTPRVYMDDLKEAIGKIVA